MAQDRAGHQDLFETDRSLPERRACSMARQQRSIQGSVHLGTLLPIGRRLRHQPERFRKDAVETYGRWLIEVRGMSETSRVKNSRGARMLPDWLGERANGSKLLARITVADIDSFLR